MNRDPLLKCVCDGSETVKKLSVEMDAEELKNLLGRQEYDTFLVAPIGLLFPVKEVLGYGRDIF